MKKLREISFLIVISSIEFLIISCRSVKPYQRIFLNDNSMQMNKRVVEKFSSKMHTYREGASGGGRGKSSGKCGCN